MVINASMRTDIPAFFSDWFYNRIETGFVDVVNPYDFTGKSYYRYRLTPDVVDALSFCSKNPDPLISDARFAKLQDTYPMIWGMTITGYSKDIEPNVPGVQEAIKTFKKLSNLIGMRRVSWRYDPICYMTDNAIVHNRDMHLRCFSYLASELHGYTDKVIVSFMDQYQKVHKRTNKLARPERDEIIFLLEKFANIAYGHGMKLYLCHDNVEGFCHDNVIQNNCMSMAEINERLGLSLKRPKQNNARSGCDCVLNAEIGQYNTCDHRCLYCYAAGPTTILEQNLCRHYETSSCLIGYVPDDAEIKNANQFSWK